MNVETLLENYQPSQEAIETVRSTKLVLLVGISGAGKDTIKHRLLDSGKYHDFVSFTTRQPRVNNGVLEKDGESYHFVTLVQMAELLRRGEMIEAKMYSGNVYGTGIHDLKKAQELNKIAINDVEVQGVDEYKKISTDVKAVFIIPPSYEEWYERFSSRYAGATPSQQDLDLRVKTAAVELKTALDAGYYSFVVNDDLDRAQEIINKIADGIIDPEEEQKGAQIATELLAKFQN